MSLGLIDMVFYQLLQGGWSRLQDTAGSEGGHLH